MQLHLMTCSLSLTCTTFSHASIFSPSLVSPSRSQHFACVLWEQCDKSQWHRCARCWVTSALDVCVHMWILHLRSPSHISQHLQCTHTANCWEQKYMSNCFSANGVALSPLRESVRRASHWKHKEGQIRLTLPLCTLRIPNATRVRFYFHSPLGLLPNKHFLQAAWMRSFCSAASANVALSKCGDLFTPSASRTIITSIRL